MSFIIPPEIKSFYDQYPEALDVFVLYDGKSYLNHFEDIAKRAADITQTTLYRVTRNLGYVPVHPSPTLKSYKLQFTSGATSCTCDGNVANISEPVNPQSVKSAMEQACYEAGVIVESIRVNDLGGNFTITVHTFNTTTFKVDDTRLTLV